MRTFRLVHYLTRLTKNRPSFLLFICFVVFIIILHYILKWEATDERMIFSNLDLDIPQDFKPVMTLQRESFPMSGSYKIPKIIHQTWKDQHIPQRFVRWIKSWLEHHPDWEYWLWTDDTAGQLIADKYPHLLNTYFGYTEPIRRADALRYIVLYEYGGLYVDMDMQAMTPIDPLVLKYSCFVGQEPYEHPIMDSNFEQLVINAIIGCRKGHPFMEMMIDNLPSYFHMWSYLDSTGPHYMTAIYHKYKSTLENSESDDEEENSVYVAPSEYFYPKIDPVKISMMQSKCQKLSSLSRLQLKACRNLKYKHSQDFNPMSIAFTYHHWYHTYLTSEFSLSYKYKNVYEVCPSAKIYGKDLLEA